MDPFTIIMGIGLALSAIGTGVQMVGAASASSATQRAEKLRQAQMLLDQQRAKREAIRKAQLAAAKSQAAAVSQGATLSDSSVIGGVSGATADGTANLTAISQNTALGVESFKANAQLAQANGTIAIGGGIGSWGSSLVNNASNISRVGASYNLWSPSASEA